MNKFECTLTEHEYLMGATCGATRRIHSMFDKAKDAAGLKESNWNVDISGAIAEVAFAKINGFYWGATCDTFKATDVGIYQVRGTSYHDGYLVIRPKDSSKDIFALITGTYPIFRFVGWIYGKYAKRDEFWFDPRDGRNSPYWKIEQEILYSPETLPSERLKE